MEISNFPGIKCLVEWRWCQIQNHALLTTMFFLWNSLYSIRTAFVLPNCSLLTYFYENTLSVMPRSIMDCLPDSTKSSSRSGTVLFTPYTRYVILPGTEKELSKCWKNKYMVNCLHNNSWGMETLSSTFCVPGVLSTEAHLILTNAKINYSHFIF